MAVGDDKIADFTVDNYAALKLQHPQRETCSVPEITDIDCFSTSEFLVHKALMSFPNGSSAVSGDSVIKSCEGTQQGDPESPALSSDSIQDLIDSLESKINLWYLDDGNLSDDYRTVLKDLKKNVEAARTLGLKIKPTKCEIFFHW